MPQEEGPTIKSTEALPLAPISHEVSLNTIRAHGTDIVSALLSGDHFHSTFIQANGRRADIPYLLPDIPDIAEQMGLVCQAVLPMQDETGGFIGKSKEITIRDIFGKETKINILENHYNAIKAVVFSHIVDDIVDDAKVQKDESEKVHESLRAKLIKEIVSYPLDSENPEADTIHMRTLFARVMSTICRPDHTYEREYSMDNGKKTKLKFNLDIRDIEDLLKAIPSRSGDETKRDIARKNWLNAIIVGMVNTGQEFVKWHAMNEPMWPGLENDSYDLKSRIEEIVKVGIGYEKELMKVLFALNPFFKESGLLEIFEKGIYIDNNNSSISGRQIPREVQMSFGSGVMGMFLVYGDYDLNENEIMALNCQIGPMVYLNNRTQDQYISGHKYLPTALETAKLADLIKGFFGPHKLRLPQEDPPYIEEYKKLVEKVTQYLDDYYSQFSIEDISPVSKEIWKLYLFAHLRLSLGKEVHAYDNFPSYEYSPFYKVERLYPEWQNIPKPLHGKTNAAPWKGVFDIPMRLYFDYLNGDRLDSRTRQILNVAQEILAYDALRLAQIKHTSREMLEVDTEIELHDTIANLVNNLL